MVKAYVRFCLLPSVSLWRSSLSSFLLSRSSPSAQRFTLRFRSGKGTRNDALKNAGVDVALDPTTGDVIVPVRDLSQLANDAGGTGLPASIPDGYDSLPISRWVQAVRLNRCD